MDQGKPAMGGEEVEGLGGSGQGAGAGTGSQVPGVWSLHCTQELCAPGLVTPLSTSVLHEVGG